MGICSSCDSASVSVVTAKVILQDGQLQEFSNPVKVSHVLQKSPTCFICDSDDMDFGGFVRAVNGDEELQLGQLYFVLPLSWLSRPLRAEQMAALAVRASLALGNTRRRKRCFGCGRKRVNQVVFTIKKKDEPSRMVAMGSYGGSPSVTGRREVVKKRRGRGRGRHSHVSGNGGGGGFVKRLSVILEDEDMMEGA
ncbi:PREDICTED: uncharacterized protein LOC103335503 [Prunus mume]|uniref:Uncharacterized protein LOC103335503 n=1 Tax=Prunus mume TaxID=102107 RepID=A0ABM0PAI2_PRUMU|nr:PREDICTED: uncharacterized protein LOC103335503 [Prunus mume]